MRYRYRRVYRRRPWICRVSDRQIQGFGILFAIFYALYKAVPQYFGLFQRHFFP
jgi:hypothetical protein